MASRDDVSPTAEAKLHDLRTRLAGLGDAFTRLGRELPEVKFPTKAVDGSIGEILLELDTWMGWDDE